MSLLIGEFIKDKLTAENEKTAVIREIVGDNVSPVIVPRDWTEGPAIVFGREECTPEAQTKDFGTGRGCEDRVRVMVMCMGRTYMEAVNLAQAVRMVLADAEGEYEEFRVTDCAFAGADEDYSLDLDMYVQVVYFDVTTENL